MKYGELPLEEHHQMAIATDVYEELAWLLASGMLETLTTFALVTKSDIPELKNFGSAPH